MRRFYAVLLALFLLSTASLAQEKPEAPKPKTDRKVFFVGVSLLAASATADAISTRRILTFQVELAVSLIRCLGLTRRPWRKQESGSKITPLVLG